MIGVYVPQDATAEEARELIRGRLSSELVPAFNVLANGQNFTTTQKLARLFGVTLIPSAPRKVFDS